MHEALKHYPVASKARDLLGAELKSFTAAKGLSQRNYKLW